MRKKYTAIAVSETFYSIQGEGISAGVPAVFLRLSGCNLLCDGKWKCDTIEVWRKGTRKTFSEVLTAEQTSALKEGARLVVTGGEPLLQMPQLVSYFEWFTFTHGFLPLVEIETNGTITPSTELDASVFQYNVSPKLSNSGERIDRRFNEDALRWFDYCTKAYFKLVISDATDFLEFLVDYISSKGPIRTLDRVILMPAGDSQELLNASRLEVLELCKDHQLRYSDRLHIVAWNKKTGV